MDHIDMRQLNVMTVRDAYIPPRINDTIDNLIGTKHFTKMDLRGGY